jgi:hypothetical protein
MADPESTSPEYKKVLRLLILLNSSLRFISLSLKELTTSKLFSADYLKRLSAVTAEVEKYVNKSNPQ